MRPSLLPGAVVVGVDGSSGGDVALAWAAGYAHFAGRRLVVVNVTDARGPSDTDADRAVTDRALAMVEQQQPSVPVSALDVVGDPRAVLVDLGRDASALVVGSRGHGPLASLLLGSVSVALAAHPPCPLVVARPQTDAVAATDLSVVVGVDADGDAADALTLGFELAAAHYRPLQVVHALGAPSLFPCPDVVGSDLLTRSLDAARDVLDQRLAGYDDKFPDVQVHRRVVQATPTQALVAASQTASSVIVGCRGRRTVSSHVLGSVSRGVVERAHSTVLVVGRTGS